MINPDFFVTKDQAEDFTNKGFLLLKNFYKSEFISYLQATIDDRIDTPTDKYQSGFSRLAFDMYEDDPVISSAIQNHNFKKVMRQLTNRNMFFAQALSFELERNLNKGFPWHIGTQSFGYHRAEDYGCTIWAPLVEIDPQGQRGGMAYVPKNMVSGNFMYSHVDPAIFDLLSARIQAGEETTTEYFVQLRDGPLNDGVMKDLLGHFSVEDRFEVGDALIFDKNVIHRSIMLNSGPLERRAAFVMRFFCETSRYDKKRAHALEIPRDHFNYAGPTRFHLQVAENDGDLLVESERFANQPYRALKHKG
ncbi:hypothetical protein [Pseudomonas citronellolis]|uniref:hypothetical protein n=1 Tax=Pseudomonas citronellolis TaxID=53408 RepID=UPI0023E46D81|nr:hypothetical protein [Pseudomonas citronellolis]MDF3934829.1 hypothetical protein [Pseudomonas citronellolis]